MTKKYLGDLTYEIIGAAIEVHKIMGPGLLETVYHQCLSHEFHLRGLENCTEFHIPVLYKDLELKTFFRCDFFVQNAIVLELKAVECVQPIHVAYLINYMKLLGAPKGIMINFNCMNLFKEGQKTYVNEIYRNLPDE